MIIPSVAVSNWKQIEALAELSSTVFFALGLHPVWQDEHQDDVIAMLDDALSEKHSQCVAVGECGLDFAMEGADRDKQVDLLEKQLALSIKYDLPVILHCRKAHNELLQILNKFPESRGVLHAFSGSYELGMNYIKRGFFLGIGGTITYPRANKTRHAVSKFSLEHLLLETDSPDMPVNGCQGQANSPDKIVDICRELSSLKHVEPDEIACKTFLNVQNLFELNT
ncbi:TatD family hydrolase [Veronia nyctiphanis]|uniref:TatD family hydrolase n=1 Tax=Veronia nyctiphanis TaxID=1278244 RepID=UPI001F286829|nr:TatD family hydrolase [Veronia nyctiphanis]